jgi:hypothetical protein
MVFAGDEPYSITEVRISETHVQTSPSQEDEAIPGTDQYYLKPKQIRGEKNPKELAIKPYQLFHHFNGSQE